jgi:hypothetical protein
LGTWAVGTNWDRFEKADLLEVVEVRFLPFLLCFSSRRDERWGFAFPEQCMGGPALATILTVFAEEYGHRTGGIPDLWCVLSPVFLFFPDSSWRLFLLLSLWNPSTRRVLFAEIKGPGDTLSETQKVWLDVLLAASAASSPPESGEGGVEVEVTRVVESREGVDESEDDEDDEDGGGKKRKKRRKSAAASTARGRSKSASVAAMAKTEETEIELDSDWTCRTGGFLPFHPFLLSLLAFASLVHPAFATLAPSVTVFALNGERERVDPWLLSGRVPSRHFLLELDGEGTNTALWLAETEIERQLLYMLARRTRRRKMWRDGLREEKGTTTETAKREGGQEQQQDTTTTTEEKTTEMVRTEKEIRKPSDAWRQSWSKPPFSSPLWKRRSGWGREWAKEG